MRLQEDALSNLSSAGRTVSDLTHAPSSAQIPPATTDAATAPLIRRRGHRLRTPLSSLICQISRISALDLARLIIWLHLYIKPYSVIIWLYRYLGKEINLGSFSSQNYLGSLF